MLSVLCRIDSRKYYFAERVVKSWNNFLAQPYTFGNFNSFIMKSDLSILVFFYIYLSCCFEVFYYHTRILQIYFKYINS